MTEPTIDELTQEKIWELLLEIMSQGERHGLNSSILTPYHTQLLTLISDQVAKARIDELKHIVSGSEYSADDFDWYEITRAEYTGTKYYSEVRHLTKEERIAELEATLNGVKK